MPSSRSKQIKLSNSLVKVLKVKFEFNFRQEILNSITTSSIEDESVFEATCRAHGGLFSAESYLKSMESGGGVQFIVETMIPNLQKPYAKENSLAVLDHLSMVAMKKTVEEIFKILGAKFEIRSLRLEQGHIIEILEDLLLHSSQELIFKPPPLGVRNFLASKISPVVRNKLGKGWKTTYLKCFNSLPKALFKAAVQLLKEDSKIILSVTEKLNSWFEKIDVELLFRLLYDENRATTDEYNYAIESDLLSLTAQIIRLSKLQQFKLPQKIIEATDYVLTYRESIGISPQEVEKRKSELKTSKAWKQRRLDDEAVLKLKNEAKRLEDQAFAEKLRKEKLARIKKEEKKVEMENLEREEKKAKKQHERDIREFERFVEEQEAIRDFNLLSESAQYDFFIKSGPPYGESPLLAAVILRWRSKKAESDKRRARERAEKIERFRREAIAREEKLKRDKAQREAYNARHEEFGQAILREEKFKHLDRKKLKINGILYSVAREKFGLHGDDTYGFDEVAGGGMTGIIEQVEKEKEKQETVVLPASFLSKWSPYYTWTIVILIVLSFIFSKDAEETALNYTVKADTST